MSSAAPGWSAPDGPSEPPLPSHYIPETVLAAQARRIAELEAELAAQAAATALLSNITQMLQSVSDAVVVADLDLRIHQWNPAAEALYGWPAAEVLGRRTAELLAVRYPDGNTHEHVLQALQTEGSWRGEAIVTRHDGQERIVEATAQLLYEPSGAVVGSLSISRDITAAKAAEAERERLLVGEQKARAAAEAASQRLAVLADVSPALLESAPLHTDVGAALQAKDSALTLLDTLFASAPVGLAFLDTKLRYVRVNQMLAEMGGLDAEAYLGHTARELLPDLAAIIEPLHQQVLQTGEALHAVPLRSTTPATPGVPRDWLASYYPVRGPDNVIVGLGVVVVDVTERTLAEAALRERTTVLELAADAAELGIWRRDFTGELVQLDVRAQAHYGFDRAEGPIAEVLARAHPDDVAAARRQIALAFEPASDGRYNAEYRMIHPDGAAHWLSVQGRLFFADDVAGRRLAIAVGTSQDITARKRTEQQLLESAAALRASEQRFRLLAEHAHDLIYRYRLSPEPGFEYVSPSATALTGYTPEEHYADPGLGIKLVHPEDRELLQRLSQDPAAAGAPITLRWRRKDGSVMWTEQINQVITDAAGMPVAIEGIARDVTARKEAEEQVRAALAAEQSARQAAEQAAVYSKQLEAMATALSAALTQDAVAAVVIGHGSHIAGASAVALALLDTTGAYVTVINAVGRDATVIHEYSSRPISALPPLEHCIRTQEPLWLTSPDEAEGRFPGTAAILAKLGDQAKATLPLVTGGRTIGVISLSFATMTPFSLQERALFTTMAQQCAQALDRARLYDEIVETRGRLQQLSQRLLEAQEHERRHIARELHDEVGQALGALKINLHMLGLPASADTTSAQLADSLSVVDTLIQQVRALSLELRPSVLDDLGLAAALGWYCERVRQRTGLAVCFENHLGDQPVTPLIATACFRIAQEALSNVARHAQARHVTVSLSYQQSMLVLGVCDDGVGFDVRERRAQASTGSSLGLISMAERAELAGGWADISSSPSEGTEIWAWLPVHPSVEVGLR